LLVGVTVYQNLPPSRHLEGPGNDVELMHKLLVEQLRFSPDQIVTLSEKDGKAKGEDFLPTRANIRREFERLSRAARDGDQVMIHLSGRGSRQPGDPMLPDPEPDGFDKIFLPCDAGRWDDARATVANAILNNEIALWSRAIREKKASVWITFDSCHAGTLIVGAGNERPRDLDMANDLGIPRKTLGAAVRNGAPRAPFRLAGKGGIVAICAAQPAEVTVECEMPRLGRGGKVYGLLSYTVAQVLLEASERSARQITYAELARRVQAQYVAWGRTFPTPLIEGGDRDCEILSDKLWPGRSSIQLAGKGDGLKVNAGAVHGLTPDSILSVSRAAGKGKGPLGYLKVKEARPFDSDVEPCDKDGKPARTEFPQGAVCEKYLIAAGDQRLRVAVDPIDGRGRRMTGEFQTLLRKQVAAAALQSRVIQVVDGPEKADWLVRRWSKADDKIILVPAAGWGGRDNADSDALGPILADARTSGWLAATLEAIHRAECVKRLVASGGEGGERALQVKAELVRFKTKNRADRKEPISLPWEGNDLPIYADDYLGLRLSNPGKSPIDVTVLFVSARYGISSLFPRQGELNRLEPNDSLLVPGYFRLDPTTLGREPIIVLAVKAPGPPVDFSVLEQRDLDGTTTRDLPRPISRGVLACPLGRLLRRALTGEGDTRGLTREEVDDYAALMIPLLTRNEKRPTEPPKK